MVAQRTCGQNTSHLARAHPLDDNDDDSDMGTETKAPDDDDTVSDHETAIADLDDT